MLIDAPIGWAAATIEIVDSFMWLGISIATAWGARGLLAAWVMYMNVEVDPKPKAAPKRTASK